MHIYIYTYIYTQAAALTKSTIVKIMVYRQTASVVLHKSARFESCVWWCPMLTHRQLKKQKQKWPPNVAMKKHRSALFLTHELRYF